jgi:hypothetical protein
VAPDSELRVQITLNESGGSKVETFEAQSSKVDLDR